VRFSWSHAPGSVPDQYGLENGGAFRRYSDNDRPVGYLIKSLALYCVKIQESPEFLGV
jgi:hypothetical protein